MPDILKVSVALTGEQVSILKLAVEAGEYATTSEIIREALRDWQFKHDLRREELARMRAAWDQGVNSGEAAPVDMKELRTEARKRLKLSTEKAG